MAKVPTISDNWNPLRVCESMLWCAVLEVFAKSLPMPVSFHSGFAIPTSLNMELGEGGDPRTFMVPFPFYGKIR